MSDKLLNLPAWFAPFTQHRMLKGIYGGRGSAKSESVARWFLMLSLREPDANFMCAREIQGSIRDSVKKSLDDLIDQYGLSHHFESRRDFIHRVVDGERRGHFTFVGLRDVTAANSIKSASGYKYLWIEEAATISQEVWDKLLPTFRRPGVEVWATWNPERPTDVVDKFFRQDLPASSIFSKDDYIVAEVNYNKNPWFNLEDNAFNYKLMLADKELDPDKYEHKWLGGYNIRSDNQVFHEGVHFFLPSEVEFNAMMESRRADRLVARSRIGVDWGVNDPMAVVKLYIDDANKEVFITNEFYRAGVKVDDLVPSIRSVNVVNDCMVIVADSARKELVEHCKSSLRGLKSAVKGKGSVEAGISKLKRYSVFIHPSCEGTIEEFKRYKYKTERDGTVTNVLEDKFNHAIDAIRYAMEDIKL